TGIVHYINNIVELLPGKIGRYLQQYGARLAQFGINDLQAAQQALQRLLFLQFSQVRRIRATYIYCKIIYNIIQFPETDLVILRSIIIGRYLVLADITPDNDVGPAAAQPFGGGFYASVVKAHPVDQGFICGQAKQSRLVVAILSYRRQRTDLDETETQRGQFV